MGRRDTGVIPARRSRNWDRLQLLRDATLTTPDGRPIPMPAGTVYARLRRRGEDWSRPVVIPFPEAWFDDLDLDPAALIVRRANRAWRRMLAATPPLAQPPTDAVG